MNGNRKPFLPAELREHLGDLPPEDRRDMELVWDRLGRDEPRAIEAPGVDEAWADLSRRTAQASARPAARRERPPVPPRGGRGRAWFAVVVVAVLVAVGSWWWLRPVVVTVPPGAIATVRLPDGSAVELNSDSELRYQRRFQAWPLVDAAVRSVTLRGEGFFEVARSERPFVVETADARVEALGTQFNVRARGTAADRETTVTLASGRVRVSLRGEAGRGALLTEVVLAEAGASARVVPTSGSASELVTRAGPLDPVLAWRRRAFSAVDRPMASILAEVERHFAVAITVEGPLDLSDSMTVFYGPQVASEDILHDLCLVQGCRFRRTSRGFAVTAKPAAAPGRDV